MKIELKSRIGEIGQKRTNRRTKTIKDGAALWCDIINRAFWLTTTFNITIPQLVSDGI